MLQLLRENYSVQLKIEGKLQSHLIAQNSQFDHLSV